MGTECAVRPLAGGEWRPHKTKLRIVCHGHLWENGTHIGLAWGEWEVKARLQDISEP
jgi:hypothetical protein